jgi:hypothetical protein
MLHTPTPLPNTLPTPSGPQRHPDLRLNEVLAVQIAVAPYRLVESLLLLEAALALGYALLHFHDGHLTALDFLQRLQHRGGSERGDESEKPARGRGNKKASQKFGCQSGAGEQGLIGSAQPQRGGGCIFA